MQPYDSFLSLNPARSSINVWLGPRGATAHCHYDGYYNFYVQIYGRKRFVLFPPTAHQVLGVYPFLHPHHAQAITNVTQVLPELCTVDDGGNAKHASDDVGSKAVELRRLAVVADLAPGDVLYLPPLWFHHVIAVRRRG